MCGNPLHSTLPELSPRSLGERVAVLHTLSLVLVLLGVFVSVSFEATRMFVGLTATAGMLTVVGVIATAFGPDR